MPAADPDLLKAEEVLTLLKKGRASREDAKVTKIFKFALTFLNSKASLDQ
jgi:hypothetical protein